MATPLAGALFELTASPARLLCLRLSSRARRCQECGGWERVDPAGRGSPDPRNGTTPKTVLTEVGPVPLAVPRDRVSTFESRLVPKGARRVGGGLDEMIISCMRVG